MYDKTFFNRRLKVPRRPPWMLPFLPARSKLKSDRAARLSFRQCFATSAPVQHESIHQNCYWALIDATNRLNRPMQHILILFFVFSWLIVANRSSRETTSGIQKFPRRRKSGGGQYMINNGGSSSTCQNPVVQCEIDWQYPYTTEEQSACVKIRSEFRGNWVFCGQRSTDLLCAKNEHRGYWLDRKTHFNKQHWPVKPMVCMNVNPEILLIY